MWKASSDPIRKAYVNKIVINEGETPQSVQQQIQAGTVDLALGCRGAHSGPA